LGLSARVTEIRSASSFAGFVSAFGASFAVKAACLDRVDDGGGSSSFAPSAAGPSASRTAAFGRTESPERRAAPREEGSLATVFARSSDGSIDGVTGDSIDGSGGSGVSLWAARALAAKPGALLSRGPAPRCALPRDPFLALLLIAPHPIPDCEPASTLAAPAALIAIQEILSLPRRHPYSSVSHRIPE
jgi:hypothetical protein